MSPLPGTTTGLPSHLAGALAYILGPISGIALLYLEKEDTFARFHAAQSIVAAIGILAAMAAYSLLSGVLAMIPMVGWLIGLFLGAGLALACFALWILLMFRALQGEVWELPLAGLYARRMLSSRLV